MSSIQSSAFTCRNTALLWQQRGGTTHLWKQVLTLTCLNADLVIESRHEAFKIMAYMSFWHWSHSSFAESNRISRMFLDYSEASISGLIAGFHMCKQSAKAALSSVRAVPVPCNHFLLAAFREISAVLLRGVSESFTGAWNPCFSPHMLSIYQ